jgi:hypothetical protein
MTKYATVLPVMPEDLPDPAEARVALATTAGTVPIVPKRFSTGWHSGPSDDVSLTCRKELS